MWKKCQSWGICACDEGKGEEIYEKTGFNFFSLTITFWVCWTDPEECSQGLLSPRAQGHAKHTALPHGTWCSGTSLLHTGGTAPSRNMVCGDMTQNKWSGAQSANSRKTSHLEVPKSFSWVKLSKQIVATLPRLSFCNVPSKRERIFLSQFGGKRMLYNPDFISRWKYGFIFHLIIYSLVTIK